MKPDPFAAAASAGHCAGRALVVAVTTTALLGAAVMLAGAARPDTPAQAASPVPSDPTRFLLNALLAPALDADAVPLRWADPRPPARCGAGTEVHVNGAPLVTGALLPDAPFELDWLARACRPFGASGPRFDGRVRLTVFREDWGLSAIVEPTELRIGFIGRELTLTRRRGLALPFFDDAVEPIELTPAYAGG